MNRKRRAVLRHLLPFSLSGFAVIALMLVALMGMMQSASAAGPVNAVSTGDGSLQSTQINTAFAKKLSAAVGTFNFQTQTFVPAANIPVTFTAPASGASGTFSNGTNTVTLTSNATGFVETSVFTANGVIGSFQVEASVAAAHTSTGSDVKNWFFLENTQDPTSDVPTQISIGNGIINPVNINQTFSPNIQVAVFNGSLSLLPGALVTFEIEAGDTGASGTFSGGGTTSSMTTGGNGLANAPAITANNRGGGFSVKITASKNGVSKTIQYGLTINPVTTQTSLTYIASYVYGQQAQATLTAKVTPAAGAGNVPSGQVQFRRDGTLIVGCESVTPTITPTNEVEATCVQNTGNQTTWAGAGTHTLTASYLGDGGTLPSTSATVTQTVNKANTSVSLTVNPTSPISPASVTFTATVTGVGVPSGTVTFVADGSNTLGTVALNASGIATFSTSALTPGPHTIQATYNGNTNYNTSSDSEPITVRSVPVVTDDPDDVDAELGETVTFTVAGTGVPSPTVQWQVSTDGGNNFGNIAGATSFTLNVTVTAAEADNRYRAVLTNSAGSDTSAAATLTLQVAPTITSGNATTFLAGTSGTFTVTADGVPAPTFSVSGTLPAGVTLNTTSGVLSGTPAAGTGGVYPVTITASNGVNPNATQPFTLTVNEVPYFTSANTTTFTVGTAGTFTVTADGYPTPITLTLTDTLPDGVTFDPGTGELSGTPEDGAGGEYTLTFTASNGVTADGEQVFTLVVNEEPAFTSADETTFTVGTAGTFDVTAVAVRSASMLNPPARPAPGFVASRPVRSAISRVPT